MIVYPKSELAKVAEAYDGMGRGGRPFSTRELDSMGSFAQRLSYCRDGLEQLGRGSGRIAFLMPNGHVLKLAANRKGVAQNEVECGDYYKNMLLCFPNVYDCADDYTWCEVERAEKAKKSDFPAILGLTFEEVRDTLVDMTRQRGTGREFRNMRTSTPKERLEEIEQAVWDDPDGHPTLYGLYDYIGNYGAEEYRVGDLFTPRNWGIVERGGRKTLVATDSGLNDEVYGKFYRRI